MKLNKNTLIIFSFLMTGALTSQETLVPQLSVTTITKPMEGSVGGVSIDILSDLYVADFGRKVWRISRHGEVELFTNAMYGSSGNAVDEQGNLLQSEFYGNTISKIYKTGKVEEIAHEGLNGPVAIVVSNDTVYVCNYKTNAILKVSLNGEVFEFCQSELLVGPNGITMGPNGNFYVTNFRDPNIIKIDRKGHASIFSTLPTSTGGHIVYHQSSFYVTSFADHKILKLSLSGQSRVFAGSGIQGSEDGSALEAQFSNPNGIVGFRNSLFVNDLISDPNGGPSHTIIRKIEFASLSNLLNQALAKGGIDEVKKVYMAYKSHPSYVNENTEGEINRLGYTLLSRGQKEDALGVFELNVSSYPTSFNTWDSLAEVHMILGHKDEAIKNYNKSLDLNPKNNNATQKLIELNK